MAKESGLGDNFYVSGYDVSGDVTAIDTISGGPSLLENTGINKFGMERVGGVLESQMACTSWFNPTANQAHDRLSNLPVTDILASYRHTTTLGAAAADLLAKQINYDMSRGDDGSLTFEVEAQGSAGVPLEWGVQLTAGKRTDSAATNGTGIDFTTSSAFGLAAYLHVFAFTGTSVTVKIQESSDNAVGDPYADVVGGAFTAATGITFQRIATATPLTVERWLRVVTTGTFTNAMFSCTVVRYLTAPPS